MPVNRIDLADYSYFLAIARHRNFRRAGVELGVSTSALSHSLKGLETRIGIRLINRTNRSVTLTAAGEELQAAISDPFDRIEQAVDSLNRFRDVPKGRIRLNVPSDAASLLLGPALPHFVERYPDIALDLAVSNQLVDVIDGGFDAGIRYGGTVPEDMIAQRLSADIRWGGRGVCRLSRTSWCPTAPARSRSASLPALPPWRRHALSLGVRTPIGEHGGCSAGIAHFR